MDLSDFQRKAILLIFISILAGSILIARKEPLKNQKDKNVIEKIPRQKTQIISTSAKIDINTADVNKIMELPGIGPVMANEIINYREKHGLFSSLEDLRNIPGIGEKKLSRIKEMIDLPEKIPEQSASEKTSVKETPQKISENTISKIDLNTANITELSSVSGIGPGIAQSIIDYRTKNGKFTSIEELTNISGIGEKRFEKFKEYFFVESPIKTANLPINQTTGEKTEEEKTLNNKKAVYDSRIDSKAKCPYCEKQLWEKGRRKIAYIRCPHCLKLLT